jgi:hypothetical protein
MVAANTHLLIGGIPCASPVELIAKRSLSAFFAR